MRYWWSASYVLQVMEVLRNAAQKWGESLKQDWPMSCIKGYFSASNCTHSNTKKWPIWPCLGCFKISLTYNLWFIMFTLYDWWTLKLWSEPASLFQCHSEESFANCAWTTVRHLHNGILNWKNRNVQLKTNYFLFITRTCNLSRALCSTCQFS